ncbi:MAG: histidine kinase [Prevotellaceae bacterium]|jgi:hypothetical protein|nr:histidine kinase [Prevotellaceae bacterium]
MSAKNNFHLSIHLLVWGGIMLIPFAMSYLQGMPYKRIAGMLPVLLGYTVIFYLNYVLLIDRYLFNKKISKFVVVNFLIIVAVRIAMLLLHDTVFPIPPHITEKITMLLEGDTALLPPAAAERMFLPFAGNSIFPMPHEARDQHIPMFPGRMQPTIFSFLSQVMVVGTSVAIKVTTRWYKTQAKILEMEKEKSAAELQQLKSQLNPHFLFNSLNNIYALIAFNPHRAQLAMHNLSDMLRYQLYETSKERIPLQKEVEFVRDYCNLIKLRLTENVRLTLELPEDDKGIAIAPLLFIAPVENAFKHGISPTKTSYIHIRIAVGEDLSVTCTVRNSSFPKTERDKSGSGIGLENLRKRLDLIYPNRHRWMAKEENGVFTAQICIYQKPPQATA